MTAQVLAHAANVAAGHLVLVFCENGEPLHGLELGLICLALRFGHVLERFPQARGALVAHRLQVGLVAPDFVLRFFHLQQRRDTHAELGFVDRLGDKVVRAGFDGVQPVFARLEARHEDDGHVVAHRILADAPADVEAVESGHHDIQQDEIDAELQLGEPFDAVARGFDLVSQSLHEHLRDSADSVVIVDHEDALASDADSV